MSQSQIEIKYFNLYYTKLPHYIESENNLQYSTPDACCFDICAAISTPHLLYPGQRWKCPTGVKFAPENPFWYRINGRSGLALNHGIIPIGGIIDTDYRGEPQAILLNTNPIFPNYIEITKDTNIIIDDTETAEYASSSAFLNLSGKELSVEFDNIVSKLPYGYMVRICNHKIDIFEYAYIINPKDKIAQIEFPFPYRAKFIEISHDEFEKLTTQRGSGGFGSSGK